MSNEVEVAPRDHDNLSSMPLRLRRSPFHKTLKEP